MTQRLVVILVRYAGRRQQNAKFGGIAEDKNQLFHQHAAQETVLLMSGAEAPSFLDVKVTERFVGFFEEFSKSSSSDFLFFENVVVDLVRLLDRCQISFGLLSILRGGFGSSSDHGGNVFATTLVRPKPNRYRGDQQHRCLGCTRVNQCERRLFTGGGRTE